MKRITLFLALSLLAAAESVRAEIDGPNRLSIDFANSADATKKATWSSDPNIITVSKNGLGWEGDRASHADGWIQTKPVALGLSWRPTYAISVRCEVQPPPREITLDNGQKLTPDAGDMYVRFSPDRVHWSGWQALQRAEPQSVSEKKQPGRYYTSIIRVADRDRKAYSKLVWDYAQLDVPWTSDEEAAVQWILGRDSDFFVTNIPFIGYVEFLYEPGFYGGQAIQSFKADISYNTGGIYSIPKDPAVEQNRHIPWRFVGKE